MNVLQMENEKKTICQDDKNYGKHFGPLSDTGLPIAMFEKEHLQKVAGMI